MLGAKFILPLMVCTVLFGFNSDGDFFIRAEVQESTGIPPPPEMLAYDDGSPVWFSWSGTYRGVWFDLEDFMLQPPFNYWLESVEMWFYHHDEYPWDISTYSCELWQGDLMGPTSLVEGYDCTAQHYSAVSCSFDLPYLYPQVFWIILGMEESSGGWPSVLCDNTGYSNGGHSFFTNDFIVWEPWIIQESHCFPLGSESRSWGNLKTLF